MKHSTIVKFRYLLSTLSLVMITFMQAHTQVIQDVNRPKVEVILNNGSKLTGKYIALIPEESLSISIFDKDTITIKWQSMKSFAIKESSFNETKVHILRKGSIHDNIKVATHMSMFRNNQVNGVGISLGGLYILNSRFMTGVSVGISNYSQNDGENIFKIGNESRYYILPKAVTPFIYMKTGYGFGITSDKYNISQTEGSMYYNPGLGFSFGHDLAFELILGLNFQRTSFVYGIGESTTMIERRVKRIEVGLGFSF